MTNKEYFDGKCPYTDKSCDKWDCLSCDINKQEKEETEKMDKAEYEEWQGYHGNVIAPKGTFEKIWNDAKEDDGTDLGDYPDTVHNQFDNMTGSMNL